MKEHHQYYEDDERPGRRIGGTRALVGMVVPILAIVAMLLLVGTVGTAFALPASAHARFVGSDPAEGSRLAEVPATVLMQYSEEISPQFVDTAVVPPGQEPVVTEAVVDGTDVTVEVAGSGVDLTTAGEWQVVARVVSADGHPVEHTARFVVEAGAAPVATTEGSPEQTEEPVGTTTAEAVDEPAGEPSEPAATVPDDPAAALRDGVPSWLAVLVALGVAGAGAAAVVVALRRRDTGG